MDGHKLYRAVAPIAAAAIARADQYCPGLTVWVIYSFTIFSKREFDASYLYIWNVQWYMFTLLLQVYVNSLILSSNSLKDLDVP